MRHRIIHNGLRGLVAAALLILAAAAAQAQSLPSGLQPSGQASTLPAELTPEMVDALLARLSDAEVRALLRDELRRRATEAAAAETTDPVTLIGVRDRLTRLAENIRTRLADWAVALGNLGARAEPVRRALDRASDGVAGMIAAALTVGAAGIAAAALAGWLTLGWRRWLRTPAAGEATDLHRDAGYWDRVVRTLALGVVELIPVAAFDFATVSAAPMFAAPLGPMVDYVWIYEVGVIYSWGFLVIARRAFAADAPAIRIAHLSDVAAARLHTLVRRAVLTGAAGWLIAGLSPTLGLGFPPALITVALAGTAVAAQLLCGVALHYRHLRAEAAGLLSAGDAASGALPRIAAAAAPAAMIAYLVVAWAYWLALWIETTQQHLYGPAGTLVFLMALPIVDRLGYELAGGVIRRGGSGAGRYRGVFLEGWRLLVGIAAVFVIAGLWGLDLYAQAKGPGSPRWTGTVFDIAVTLLIARFVWRLILAALHSERRISENDEGSDAPAASRLDTLVPLFRNVLLGALVIVVGMIVLSAAGVNIGPLLASAGIIGIAVGFGAQALVRDIFSGAFFLIDDAFRVGEYIELDDNLRGEVEAISIRSLQLRHHRGAVVTIPFGELKSVTNHNRDWVIYKMSFRMEPEVDPDKVKKIVKDVGKEFLADPEHGPKFIEPLKSQGVYMIDDDSAQVFRVKFKCKPRAQFVLRREIYHRLREVFAENDIHFARRKVEVVGPDDAAAGAALSGAAAPGATAP